MTPYTKRRTHPTLWAVTGPYVEGIRGTLDLDERQACFLEDLLNRAYNAGADQARHVIRTALGLPR